MLKRLLAVSGLILIGWASIAPADSLIDLGVISENKLKVFKSYFEPYLKYDEPWYPDEAARVKVEAEAKDIYVWLRDEASWPAESKRTAETYVYAAGILTLFHHYSFDQSDRAAVDFLKKALGLKPGFHEAYRGLAVLYGRLGEGYLQALAAERALATSPEGAPAEGAHYEAAQGLYHAGFFRRAWEHIHEQKKLDPAYDNTENLLFVMQTYIDRWGEIPEYVVFEEVASAGRVPRPSGTAPRIPEEILP